MGVANKENKCYKVLKCTTGYLLWSLENFIKYMTKNAYIQIALASKSFFPSAK